MKRIATLPYVNEHGSRLWKTELCLKACIYCDPAREYPVVCEHYVPYDQQDKSEGCREEEMGK